MAIDKVIDSAKLDTALTATANAIREKNGSDDPIAWDNNTGFATAVENIKSGDIINNQDITVTENGTYTAGEGYTGLGTVEVIVPTGGGGDTSAEDEIVAGTITEYTNNRVETIRAYAFYSNDNLTSANFPACTSIGSNAFERCSSLRSVEFPAVIIIGANAFTYCYSLTTANFTEVTSIGNGAFYWCNSLTSVNFPALTSIGSSAFGNCSSLTSVNFPSAMTIGGSAFYGCYSLTEASFPAATRIGGSAFRGCSALASLYLLGSSLCKLSNSNAFYNTGITSSTGAIYVPASLLASYQSATNWAYFSTQFVAGD